MENNEDIQESNLVNQKINADTEMYDEELDICHESIQESVFSSGTINQPEQQNPKFFWVL